MDRRIEKFFRAYAGNRRTAAISMLTVASVSLGWSSRLASAEQPQGGGSSDVVEQTSASPVALAELLHVIGPKHVAMEVTAYCPCPRCCGPQAQGITASGKSVEYNSGKFIAADTRLLPFGTRVSIPGYHEGQPVEVIDRGGAIKGNKLDVFFPTHEEALQWGRQTVTVAVFE